VEIRHIAKSPLPDQRVSCSAWAICLGVSRATAMWPDNRYVASGEGYVNTIDNFAIVIVLSAAYARL